VEEVVKLAILVLEDVREEELAVLFTVRDLGGGLRGKILSVGWRGRDLWHGAIRGGELEAEPEGEEDNVMRIDEVDDHQKGPEVLHFLSLLNEVDELLREVLVTVPARVGDAWTMWLRTWLR
jgi:hypothetical protein